MGFGNSADVVDCRGNSRAQAGSRYDPSRSIFDPASPEAQAIARLFTIT